MRGPLESSSRNRNKKIIVLLSYPFTDNPQARKEVQVLARAGFGVEVLVWDRQERRRPREMVDGIAVTNISSVGTFGRGGRLQAVRTLRFWWKALGVLRSKPFDVLHCQDLNVLPAGLIAARLKGRLVVFDAHDPYPEMFELSQPRSIRWTLKTMESFLCRRVDCIITVNQLMASRFRRLTTKPIQIIYNYPDHVLFQPGTAVPSDGRFVIGRIGSIQPGVGLEETVEALGKIRDGSRIKLLLVGWVASAYESRFEELISPIADRVEVTGFVDPRRVVEYYGRMHLSLALYHPTPIFRYLSPMKLFESMAMGVPVVASDIGEVRQVVEAYGCGVVLKHLDSDALAHAIDDLMDNPGLRQKMGINGRRAVENDLNWQKEGEKLSRYYERLLSTRRD